MKTLLALLVLLASQSVFAISQPYKQPTQSFWQSQSQFQQQFQKQYNGLGQLQVQIQKQIQKQVHQNPVPLPNAIWLLGSGLIALFSIGRRNTQKKNTI